MTQPALQNKQHDSLFLCREPTYYTALTKTYDEYNRNIVTMINRPRKSNNRPRKSNNSYPSVLQDIDVTQEELVKFAQATLRLTDRMGELARQIRKYHDLDDTPLFKERLQVLMPSLHNSLRKRRSRTEIDILSQNDIFDGVLQEINNGFLKAYRLYIGPLTKYVLHGDDSGLLKHVDLVNCLDERSLRVGQTPLDDHLPKANQPPLARPLTSDDDDYDSSDEVCRARKKRRA